jgi:hypothetical protein
MSTSWSEWIAEKALGPWILEHCDLAPCHTCRLEELHAAFTAGQRDPVSPHTVGRALRHLGYESSRLRTGRIWIGLRPKVI